jgi:hypothetical protein
MTRGIGERRLEPHVTLDDLLIPVWVRQTDHWLPGVLLRWERRSGVWWALVAWEPANRHTRAWLPAGLLRRIERQ